MIGRSIQILQVLWLAYFVVYLLKDYATCGGGQGCVGTWMNVEGIESREGKWESSGMEPGIKGKNEKADL